MNKTLSNVMIFVSGAVCGAVGMWFGVSSYYRSISDKEIEEMKAYIEKTYRNKDIVKDRDKKVQNAISKKKVDEYNAEKTMLDSYKETIQERKNYNNLNADISEDHPEEDENRDPYIISEEEWSDPEPYYEKITLLYNKSDKSFVDYETEELIVNPGDLLGMNVMDILDDVKANTYLYVRDDKTSKDYEIEIGEVEDYDDEAAT